MWTSLNDNLSYFFTAQPQARVPTLDRRPNRPAFHHLGPNPRVIPGAGKRQQLNAASAPQKDVSTSTDADVDAESDEYVDTMERRGGPARNRFRNRPNAVPIRPLPPDVVVPDFPSENFDIPYADLSHLVINYLYI